MDEKNASGRLHEPSLKEAVTELDGLRELLLSKIDNLKELVNERDRLYKERDDARRVAVDAALAAAKEQTASSFSASEKAIVKAENAQSDYNIRSNEFRGQLDDQAKRLISRTEVEEMIKNVVEKISRIDNDVRSLRESRTEGVGEKGGRLSSQALLAWGVGLVVGLMIIISQIVAVAMAIKRP